jgi:two-component system OmpR family sensor kinase
VSVRPRRPFTLTARLVAVAVLLVALTAVVIAAATALVVRDHLSDKLDESVLASIRRAGGPMPGRMPMPGPGGVFNLGNQAPGTLVALPDQDLGYVLGNRGGDRDDLGADEVSRLASMPVDGRVHEVAVDQGSFRVTAVQTNRGLLVIGQPTDDLDEAVASLVAAEAGFLLLGVVAAAGVGTYVVRRQLAPLREVAGTAHRVAELPLASGEIDLAERVPDRLTDERTEVGRVGAALNAMLDHVEASLATRHRSEQQVRQFVADASHELRTPLATIAGYTELARRRPETGATALDKVETESARMTALVEDLLLLARLDAGRPLEREPVDLSRLLLEAVDDARVVDPDRSWRLALPDEPITVTGDAARLHQVVTNLLTNARTHTPPGSTVTVTATADGFTVHDDGPGFPPDLASRAFERFARGDAARAGGGVGLGLSLVEAITLAHGGSVDLASAPGDTTVSVRLPSPTA